MTLSDEQIEELRIRTNAFCDFIWNEIGVSSAVVIIGHECESDKGNRPNSTHLMFRRGNFYESVGLLQAAKVDFDMTLKKVIEGEDQC